MIYQRVLQFIKEGTITKQFLKHTHLLEPTDLYGEAQRRLAELNKIAMEKELALQKAPQGKIHIIKSRTRVQFYLRKDPSDKSGEYLSKKKSGMIQRYVQKAYDEKVLKKLKKEIKYLESFITHSTNIHNQIKDLYSQNSMEIKSFITPIDCSDEDYINMWLEIPYEGNPYPIQIAEYRTIQGEIVRSKSELNIANLLYQHKIPYKYEAPLILKNGVVVYPDFTTLDVKRRREVYWEHRGMMDEREYAKKSVKKIKEYNKSGIVIGDNLILTEETSNSMLGTDEIEQVIRRNIFNEKEV